MSNTISQPLFERPERLLIIGASGHGKVIADMAYRLGYRHIGFLDDRYCPSGESPYTTCLGFPVIGNTQDLSRLDDGHTGFVIAIGNNAIRKRIDMASPLPWVTLIHPSASIGLGVTLGEGTVVMAGAVINPAATVGRHGIVNTCAVVEHDNVLGNYVHISPNAALGGTVTVGDCTHIGIGASVRQGIHIGSSCTVGAGAVVVKDLPSDGVYVGIPAKPLCHQ